MKISDAPMVSEGDTGLQRNDGWYADRCAKITASPILKVYKKLKSGGYSSERETYFFQVLGETLTGVPASGFKSAAMQRGIDKEAEAREAYQRKTNYPVYEAPFIPHPRIERAGASPDGFVGEDGLVEIKCPNSATTAKVLLSDYLDETYAAQMQWQMACTGRQWCDYAVYDDRMPEHLRLYVRRINRDDALIADVEKEVIKFLEEIDAAVAALTKKYAA
jgi:putative phage-type endonuclease